MIVKEIGREHPVPVYGVYWVGGERYYWVIPYVGYGGLMSLRDRDVTVIDSSLSNDFILCKDGAGDDMILHWAAEDLICDLVERDPIAMAEFLRRLQQG